MSGEAKILYMSVEEYLEAEERATVRHEYVDGQVFAMSGATEAHNVIAGNLYAFMHGQLRGTGCRAFMNDMKVRIKSQRSFYYPDIMVTCEPFEAKSVFKDAPTLLIEVLSPSTRQIDRREKLVSYKQIDTLKEYLVVYQDRRRVEVYRRDKNGHWELTVASGKEELLLQSLPSGPLALSMDAIYEGFDAPTIVEEGDFSYDVDGEDGDDVEGARMQGTKELHPI